MTDLSLTFRHDRFVLKNVDSRTVHRYLDESEWTLLKPGIYETNYLRAAAVFRRHSDAIAEKVFTRAFQKRYELPLLPPLNFLDDHQREGIHWILERRRSYLAHAPGAGKTCQAIVAACFAKGEGQNLFIVPPTLTINWLREVDKFASLCNVWPDAQILVDTNKKGTMNWDADFLIIPDSMLDKPWVYENLIERKFKLIAVDEASRFKEPTPIRSRAFYGGEARGYSYGGLYQEARHVVFMDGSPMPNRPMELWAPTYALHPEAIDCMDQHEFGMRYCGAKMNYMGAWEYKHSSREHELKERLHKDFMHVVTEEQLNHPERLRSMIFINKDIRSKEEKSWEQKHLQGLAIKNIDEDASQGELASHRLNLGIKKIPFIYQYVLDKLRDKNESILLFVWHREVALELARLFSKEKISSAVVMGGTTNAEREERFKRFQSGKLKLIIGNIQAMGRGHNLQKAGRVVFGEFSWSDELNKQCEKRAARKGSTHASIKCDYVVAPDSEIEERLLNSLFMKARRVKKVIG